MSEPDEGPAGPAHRILVDMSPGAAGFTGIPHESRLLLDTFWKSPGLAPTGLLFDDANSVLAHRFPKRGDPGTRLENHARFLFGVSAGQAVAASSRAGRLWARLRFLRRLLLGTGVPTQELDNAVHGESAWRLYLEKSLGPAGLRLARRCPMLLAGLSRAVLKLRARLRLPTFRLDTAGFDFLLLHEAMPLRARPETCKLVRLYDLIPGVRPELVGSRAQIEAHLRGIRRCAKDSVFVCASAPTRADLLHAFPELEERAVTVPVVLGDQLFPEAAPRRLPQICRSRRARAATGRGWEAGSDERFPPYLLTVCSIEPRKNHLALIRAFERLTARRGTDLVLVFVGSAGWRNEETLRAMAPLAEQGRLLYLEHVPAAELRILYTHAEAVVFPSFYEGFGYSPLEGMQCGAPAIASDIAAHRWVYGDAAVYFDPFDPDDLCEVIERLALGRGRTLRQTLTERGFECVRRYQSAVIGEYWRRLCDAIRAQGGGRNATRLRLADIKLDAGQTRAEFRAAA